MQTEPHAVRTPGFQCGPPSPLVPRPFSLCGGVLLLAAMLSAGCGSVIVPRSSAVDEYHQNWWNFYRSGIAALDNRNYTEARSFFETSLGLRGGAKFGFDAEAWRVRTYGLHFLNGYFPNRELGISCYYMNDDAEALNYLEKSIRLEPSGRAKHFLNLVHTRQMAGRTMAPPHLELTGSGTPAWTRERVATVTGTAAGPGLIRRIEIAGEPEFIELAQAKLAFQRTVPLRGGTNIVTVVAHDLAGQTTSARVSFVADWQPPILLIRDVERQGADWVVRGTCQDDNSVATITTDGVAYAPAPANRGAARVPVTLRIAANRPMVFQASDAAGNRLEQVIAPATLELQARLAHAPMLAALGNGTLDTGAALIAVADPSETADADTRAPGIDLGDAAAFTKVFKDEFYLDGNASDAGGLASVHIDGKEMLPAEDQGAIQSCFAQRLPLEPGTNRFEIAAVDRAGNRSVRQLTVLRQDPEYRNESFRLSLVIPPLPSDEPGPQMERIKHGLEAEVVKTPPRFHLLERDEGWDAILQELRIGVSDLADPRAALSLGRMLQADLVLQAAWLRHDRGRTVYARVIDAESAEILFDSDVYVTDDTTLETSLEGLMLKVEQNFPMVHAGITELKDKRAAINAGTAQGVTPYTRFIAYGPTDASGSAVRMVDGKLVELRVKRVDATTGSVEILPATGRRCVLENDYVCAR